MTSTPPDPDVLAAAVGDPAAFDRLVRPHLAWLYRAASVILLDRELARDAVQESLLRAYRGLRRFDPRKPLRPWLYRLVVNEARRLGRRRGREPTLIDEVVDLLPGRSGTPEQAVLEREERRRLWQAVAQLGEVHRAVLVLHYGEGLSVREVAETLGVRPGTVKSRLHYARRLLGQALADDLEECEKRYSITEFSGPEVAEDA